MSSGRPTVDVRYRPRWEEDTDGSPPAWTKTTAAGDGSPITLPGSGPGEFDVEWRTVDPSGQVSSWVRLPPQTIDDTGAVLFGRVRRAWIDCTQVLRWEYDEAPPVLVGWRIRTAEGNYPFYGFARPAHEGVLRTPELSLCGIPKGPRTFFIVPVDIVGNEGEPYRYVDEIGPYEEVDATILTSEQHGPSADPASYPGTIEAGAHDPGAQAILGQPLSTLYAGDSRPLYSGNPLATFYGGNRGDVVYVFDFVPATDAALPDSRLTVGPSVGPAAGWWVEVKHGTRPFYSGDPFGRLYDGGSTRKLYEEPFDGEWLYRGGDGTQLLYRGNTGTNGVEGEVPFYRSPTYRAWPGKFSAPHRMTYRVRITVPGSRGGDRATLSSIRFRASGPIEAVFTAELAGKADTTHDHTGRLLRVTVYSSGSGTHTFLPECTTYEAELLGGGGGGGGANANVPPAMLAAAAAGGAAGAHLLKRATKTNASEPYAVGAAGNPGAGGPGAAGTAGGNTTFGAGATLLTAPGGGGGAGSLGVAADGFNGGGGGTLATGGDVNGRGDPGGGGKVYGGATVAVGGQGGSTVFGGGGDEVNAGAGMAAAGVGAGGGGAGCLVGFGPFLGGAGTRGLIIVREYT